MDDLFIMPPKYSTQRQN